MGGVYRTPRTRTSRMGWRRGKIVARAVGSGERTGRAYSIPRNAPPLRPPPRPDSDSTVPDLNGMALKVRKPERKFPERRWIHIGQYLRPIVSFLLALPPGMP